MPSGCPVIDKSWVDGLLPCKVLIEDDPELHVVHGLAEKVGKNVECGNGFGGQFCEGRLMGFNKKSKGGYIYWPDKPMVTVKHSTYVDKIGVLNSCFEGEKRDGFIEMKIYEPIQNLTVPPSCTWNSNPPVSSDMSPSNIRPVPVNEDPNSESIDISSEPKIHPNAEQGPAGRAIIYNEVEGQETMQDVELVMPSAPESTAAAAASVDDAENAVLEGEKASDCAIAADFVNVGAGATEKHEMRANEAMEFFLRT